MSSRPACAATATAAALRGGARVTAAYPNLFCCGFPLGLADWTRGWE